MDYFNDIYLKRLNRYGLNYEQRIQTQREQEFKTRLLKSTNQVQFIFEDEEYLGILDRYRQDDTQTLGYLYTERDLVIPGGTVLKLKENRWMIYWLEQSTQQGYNRYIVLKMTHLLKWKKNGKDFEAWAHMYGSRTLLQNTNQGQEKIPYSENDVLLRFITPLNKDIDRSTYFTVKNGDIVDAYVVTGYNRVMTPGVQFVSVDPVDIRNEDEAPRKLRNDKDEDFFWLQGGEN